MLYSQARGLYLLVQAPCFFYRPRPPNKHRAVIGKPGLVGRAKKNGQTHQKDPGFLILLLRILIPIFNTKNLYCYVLQELWCGDPRQCGDLRQVRSTGHPGRTSDQKPLFLRGGTAAVLFPGRFRSPPFLCGKDRYCHRAAAFAIIGVVLSIILVGYFLVAAVGIWVLVDLIMIIIGSFTDKNGLPVKP